MFHIYCMTVLLTSKENPFYLFIRQCSQLHCPQFTSNTVLSKLRKVFFKAKNLRLIELYSFHTKNIVLFQNQPVWTPKTKTLRVQNLDTLVQLSLPV